MFDGAYHIPTVSGTILGDQVSFSQNHRNVTNGAATVTITITRGEETYSVNSTVTITPAPVTVTVGNAAKTAGAADPDFTAVVTGLVNGESADLIAYTLDRVAGEDAGTYAINAAGDRVQGNYVVTYVPGALVISAALPPVPTALPAGPAAPAAVAALDTILDDGVPPRPSTMTPTRWSPSRTSTAGRIG